MRVCVEYTAFCASWQVCMVDKSCSHHKMYEMWLWHWDQKHVCTRSWRAGGDDFLDGLYLTARHIIGEIISIKMLQNATASQTCSRDLAQWIKLATVTPSQHPAVTQMHHTPNYKHVIKNASNKERGLDTGSKTLNKLIPSGRMFGIDQLTWLEKWSLYGSGVSSIYSSVQELIAWHK